MEILRLGFDNGEPAGTLRRGARTALHGRGPDGDGGDWLEDVLLVVSELVENVTQHTRGGGELVLRVEHDLVLVEVGDGDPAPPRPQEPDDRRIGGRGLLLVSGLARGWGVTPTPAGKVVWARIAMRSDAEPMVAA